MPGGGRQGSKPLGRGSGRTARLRQQPCDRSERSWGAVLKHLKRLRNKPGQRRDDRLLGRVGDGGERGTPRFAADDASHGPESCRQLQLSDELGRGLALEAWQLIREDERLRAVAGGRRVHEEVDAVAGTLLIN